MKYGLKLVLDAFSGSGRLWTDIQRRHPEVKTVALDKVTRNATLRLDNRRFLKHADLSCFDAIDLDSYTTPCEQLELVLARDYAGVVFVTFSIVSGAMWGQLPKRILRANRLDKLGPALLMLGVDRKREAMLSYLWTLGWRRAIVSEWPMNVYLSLDCANLRQNGK